MIDSLLSLIAPQTVYAYTSLIPVDLFDGPKADVTSVVTGMITIFIIILAGTLIIKGIRG